MLDEQFSHPAVTRSAKLSLVYRMNTDQKELRNRDLGRHKWIWWNRDRRL
jgi:hypothetical protein